MKHEALNSQISVYVVACGKDFIGRRAGLEHEKNCPSCAEAVFREHVPTNDEISDMIYDAWKEAWIASQNRFAPDYRVLVSLYRLETMQADDWNDSDAQKKCGKLTE